MKEVEPKSLDLPFGKVTIDPQSKILHFDEDGSEAKVIKGLPVLSPYTSSDPVSTNFLSLRDFILAYHGLEEAFQFSGEVWETELITTHLQSEEKFLVHRGTSAANEPLSHQKLSAEQFVALLKQFGERREGQKEPGKREFIYQPALIVPQSFYDHYAIPKDLVQFSECYPDFVEVVTSSTGSFSFSSKFLVIHVLRRSHPHRCRRESVTESQVVSSCSGSLMIRSRSLFPFTLPPFFLLIFRPLHSLSTSLLFSSPLASTPLSSLPLLPEGSYLLSISEIHCQRS